MPCYSDWRIVQLGILDEFCRTEVVFCNCSYIFLAWKYDVCICIYIHARFNISSSAGSWKNKKRSSFCQQLLCSKSFYNIDTTCFTNFTNQLKAITFSCNLKLVFLFFSELLWEFKLEILSILLLNLTGCLQLVFILLVYHILEVFDYSNWNWFKKYLIKFCYLLQNLKTNYLKKQPFLSNRKEKKCSFLNLQCAISLKY